MTPIKSRIKQYPETIYIYKEQTFLVLPKINTVGIWHSKNSTTTEMILCLKRFSLALLLQSFYEEKKKKERKVLENNSEILF